MRTFNIRNPIIDSNEITLLDVKSLATQTSLSVQNTSGFSNADLIVLGLPKGCDELLEISTIQSITAPSTINLVSALSFDHEVDTPIIKIDFDEIKVYRSIDNGLTFPLLTTVTIDYSNKDGMTKIVDNTGLSSYQYKYAFFNSSSSVEDNLSQIVKFLNTLGWMTLDEFKCQTGLDKIEDSIIVEALRFGARNVKRDFFTPRRYEAKSPNTEHIINVSEYRNGKFYFADFNLDDKPIDANDFIMYEEDSNHVRIDVTGDVASINIETNIITFNNEHPASGKSLIIMYEEVPERHDLMRESLRTLQKLWAVNYVFENIPFNYLCRGITSWSLNGQSVSFDYGVIQNVIEDNRKRIFKTYEQLTPVYVAFTGFRKPGVSSSRDFVRSLRFV